MAKEISTFLSDLGFKNNEIKVYLAVTKLGEATASQIAAKANLPRTTAISILNKLTEQNFLTAHNQKGTTYFWIESPQTIVDGLETKIKIAKDLNETLASLYRTEAHFPEAVIYNTKTAIRNFIEKTISNLEKKVVIYTIDAPSVGNYSSIFSESIEMSFVAKKNAKKLVTKTLVPHNSSQFINKNKTTRQTIEIKELPAGIDFQTSLWLINDMLVLFSGRIPFLVVIRHGLIIASMKSIYDFLWKVSRPLNN